MAQVLVAARMIRPSGPVAIRLRGGLRHDAPVDALANLTVTLVDKTVEVVGGADAYAQEGPLTTFFDTAGRDVIDSWAVRLLSIRTTDIAVVRRYGVRRTASPMPAVVTGGHLTQVRDQAYFEPTANALAS